VRLYDELADRYSLLTPRSDYEEEAAVYAERLRSVLGPGPATLLELGAGAGHTASWLDGFALTLTDPAAPMLALAQANNPHAQCVLGDMRDLRLGRSFDAVFAHDALAYLLTRDDLRAALTTAWEHLRPGGALLLAPDFVAETFAPATDCGGTDGGDQGVRYLEWCWQRPGEPERIVVDYVVVHRQGGALPTAEVDRHEEGLFPRAVWEALLAEVGFEALPCPDGGLGNVLFLARRPGQE
jgi:SAM-dependent methyltransferase